MENKEFEFFIFHTNKNPEELLEFDKNHTMTYWGNRFQIPSKRETSDDPESMILLYINLLLANLWGSFSILKKGDFCFSDIHPPEIEIEKSKEGEGLIYSWSIPVFKKKDKE